ncbi:NAD(P)H-hydrate dehydratase [Candidatus Peregrinibacteria bacterium CG22_combo_CG10-13_8_21_14_all_44_10]|nr:MAG: NAD(P)H-hydrate dehydratase [Candidatus Peregrinibacteria bacterium CG2_30_44_17]PIP65888.1 MAG: NAD(P)H-hydrate dehydratase [Candidatus Peregrinibacteria bacterium CG22_combo_CG10-13_8_21_14_all_44_10]PIS04300.1 MAG: NAD(P)H-hydrate dehydratase [Candidatus Peregrinibacteria bacterium CG10_big_fil_rev_8_21_14_0_10_44_7]PIX80210.1 MAG: NAD(P)H-hydrate dehydratase [Candidatus Peregrinibacteria bacterium CG_4_10_14_3_um_filter_44_21]
MEVITEDKVRALIPVREPASHKGENGRVLLISGHSEFPGATVLAGMGALYSGADLVRIHAPDDNVSTIRSYCPEFIVRGFGGDVFLKNHLPEIADWISESDVIVVGMGSKPEPEFLKAITQLLAADKLFVLDSSAIFALQNDASNVLITPHAGEFAKFSGVRTNILLKGQVDTITSYGGDTAHNKTGHAGMTVGGSGDVLAGLCGSMMSQGLNPFDAAQVAAFTLGKAGEKLSETKWNAYSAYDLAYELPKIFAQLVS